MIYVADTCALIWYLTNDPILSREAPNVLALFDEASKGLRTVYVSTITLIELIYLMEKGKVSSNMLGRLLDQLAEPGSTFVLSDITKDVALTLKKVQHAGGKKLDMPDRIIASDAYWRNVPLFTRDGDLQNSNVQVMWR